MAQFLDLNAGGDAREAMELAVGQLAIGNLVVVPQESGWALVGLASHPMVGQKLEEISRERPEWLQAVAAANSEVLSDYTPRFGKLATRLIHRCWPGPVVLRLLRAENGLDAAWPDPSQRWAGDASHRRWIVPADEVFRTVLRAAAAPLLTLFPRPSEATVPESIAGRAAVVLIGAERRYDQPPTVASVEGDTCRILEPGVVQDRTLQRLGGEVILFVCTGNTCRSPMAEALFRRMLAERLQCQEDELIDRGFVVLSAGISAARGNCASPEAVELLRKVDGIDLRLHESQPLTEELLKRSDRILTMTCGHMESIVGAFPEMADRVRTLSPNGADVSDPIGGGPDEYERCRAQLIEYLQQLAAEICP